MAYVNWNKVIKSAYICWIKAVCLWCTQVQTDTSVVSQLQCHYREQVMATAIKKGALWD